VPRPFQRKRKTVSAQKTLAWQDRFSARWLNCKQQKAIDWSSYQQHGGEFVSHHYGEKLVFEALAIEAEQARQAGTLGYLARVFTQIGLPHSAVTGSQFVRCNGNLTLTISAISDVGLPFGSIPRLLLSWVTTEAVRTGSPVLELGPTLSAFMAELGLARQGGKRGDITRFRNQTVRLFSSAISLRYSDKTMDAGLGFNVADEYSLWWNPKSPNQLPLWKSTVTLGSKFFREIIERPVPIDLRALKALKRSPMALDIYCWLTHRMFYLQKPIEIPWPLLQLQFGADYALEGQGPRDFKKKFLHQLKHVCVIYPEANVKEGERGLALRPSPPHVAVLLESRRSDERRYYAAALPAPAPAPAPAPSPALPLLKTATYEKARLTAPGFDIYALEQDWREWIAKKSEQPKNPDSAFLGFCRRKAKPKNVG
jgi:hypothetical protein